MLVGIAFGAGWTPCIGPILGSILTFAASEASLQKGLVLLFAYSMGLAVPFLLAALAVDKFVALFAQLQGGDDLGEPGGRRGAHRDRRRCSCRTTSR